MTVYLVRYDNVGNCQYVAIASNQNQLDRFLEAGFIEVSEEEYNRCVAIAERVTIADIARLLATAGTLASILSSQRNQPIQVTGNRKQLDNLIDQFQRNSATRMQEYLDGTIDINQWYDAQARHILRNRLASRAAAVGGIDNLTAQDIQSARDAARREFTYLSQFRDELDAGNLSSKQAIARSQMYAGGAREQYERAIQDAIGLPPLPAQPGVRTDCRRNCKCSWDIRQLTGNGNFDCYWKRSPVDSCDTCKRRERAFNPLRIRNGVIQTFPTVGIYSQPN